MHLAESRNRFLHSRRGPFLLTVAEVRISQMNLLAMHQSLPGLVAAAVALPEREEAEENWRRG